jgi:hypothetical protein
MDGEREVLQHRIQIGAVAAAGIRRWKGIRGPQREQHEAALTRPMTPSTRLEKAQGQLPAEGGTATLQIDEDQYPQQQRALVRAPQRRDLVEQRQLRIGIARHVQHGEVVVDEAVHEAGERHATNTNCPVTAGRATAIHAPLPRQAPIRPKKACDRLRTNARMSANMPSSGAIA